MSRAPKRPAAPLNATDPSDRGVALDLAADKELFDFIDAHQVTVTHAHAHSACCVFALMHIAQDEYIARLAEFVAIPGVSADPKHRPDVVNRL